MKLISRGGILVKDQIEKQGGGGGGRGKRTGGERKGEAEEETESLLKLALGPSPRAHPRASQSYSEELLKVFGALSHSLARHPFLPRHLSRFLTRDPPQVLSHLLPFFRNRSGSRRKRDGRNGVTGGRRPGLYSRLLPV